MADFDTLICSARVVDGSGNPWFYGDVALRGQRIAAITAPGIIAPELAATVIDATDQVVCPGFIDIQSQSIMPLMIDGRSLSKISQGVTTEIMGEAWTPAPFGGRRRSPIANHLFARHNPEWVERARSWSRFADWLEAMIDHGVAPNIGSFLGGGSLREHVLGMEMRAPSGDELAAMRRVAAASMEGGALGVAYALIYPPDAFTATEELIAICGEVGARGGIYATHLRSESDDVESALAEAITIGERAALPVEVYHLKASGKRNWSKMIRVMAMFAEARARGVDITASMYPYIASGTGLAAALPAWVAADGELFANLRNPDNRARIKAEMTTPGGRWEAVANKDGAEVVMPIGFKRPENRRYIGQRLSAIAAARNQHWVDAVIDLLIAEEQLVNTVYFTMTEDNLRAQLPQPWMKVASDAGGYDPSWALAHGPVHPRAYGAFPRVLAHYVRDQAVLSLESAIAKMSAAPAQRLGLGDRGLLRPGMQADVVVFDPLAIADRATFDEPHQLAVGIHHVWVNGSCVIEEGAHTGAKPGQIVRR